MFEFYSADAPYIAFNTQPSTVSDELFNHHNVISGFNLLETSNLSSDNEITLYISHSHEKPIRDIRIYLSPSFVKYPARLISIDTTDNITGVAGTSLVFSVDDSEKITVNFSSNSATTIIDEINSQFQQYYIAKIDAENDLIVLESASYGEKSKIFIHPETTTSLFRLLNDKSESVPMVTGGVFDWDVYNTPHFDLDISRNTSVIPPLSYPLIFDSDNNSIKLTVSGVEYIVQADLDENSQIVLNDQSDFIDLMIELFNKVNLEHGTDVIIKSYPSGYITIYTMKLENISQNGTSTLSSIFDNLVVISKLSVFSSAEEEFNKLLVMGYKDKGISVYNSVEDKWIQVKGGIGSNYFSPIDITWAEGDGTMILRYVPGVEGEFPLKLKINVDGVLFGLVGVNLNMIYRYD